MDLLATPRRRRLLFAALYLSEGAPIGFIWWHLPTRLRAAGVPIEAITALTATLVLPWTLKFLWAPLIDAWRARGGTARAWIIAAQVVMGLALLPLLLLDLHADLPLVTALLMLHAVAAATQDAAIDTLAIASTGRDERGALNGWMQAGMLLGRSLFGGVSLVIVAQSGTGPVVLALVATIWLTLVLVAAADERAHVPPPPAADAGVSPAASGAGTGRPVAGSARRRGSLLPTLAAAARSRTTWLGLLFALSAGAGFEAVGAVAGPYLVDRGFDSARVGTFLALPAVLAMLVGGLVGGTLSDRLGRRRTAGAALVLLAGLIAAVAAAGGAAHGTLLALLTAVYGGIGVFVAASYALFMEGTDPRLGATQFSAFMAATNACEAWATFAVGRLIPSLGYPGAFLVMALISLAALPALAGMRLTRGPG